jgi:hypothetical protein
MIPGFASAERAWENANPYDSDCTCIEAEWFICADCGEEDHDATYPRDCTQCDGDVRLMKDDEVIESHPKLSCPQHGYTDQDAADDAREHDYESRMGY